MFQFGGDLSFVWGSCKPTKSPPWWWDWEGV